MIRINKNKIDKTREAAQAKKMNVVKIEKKTNA
jgi:hypothetical protein